MSRLRARCPACRTLTAVALGAGYECHACGARYAAGLVRVRGAFGAGGEPMAAAASLPLPFPEAAVVEEDALERQNRVLAAALPARPVVLGGCCCAHIGAVEGLAARHRDLALVWLDAHGDLNTPDSSPSGNAWGMALRMLLDAGAVRAARCALLGARNLDPPEEAFLAASGLATEPEALAQVLQGADGVYVAFDLDVLAPGEAHAFMPEPGGMTLAEGEALVARAAALARLAGIGFSGCAPDEANVPIVERLCRAAGLLEGPPADGA